MPRLLLVREEGSPFATRSSRVLTTVIDAGWSVDILIPRGGMGRANVAREMGRDLTPLVRIHEFTMTAGWRKALGVVTGANYFGNAALEARLVELFRAERYDAVLVKDSPSLGRVFRARARTGCDVPVACEMVEPRVPQVHDSLVTFGNWRTRLAGGLRFIEPRLAAAERRYLPQCARIFAVVEEMKAYLLRHYPIDPANVTVVHNVEPLPGFDAIAEPGVPPRTGFVRLSHVGTFGPHRGIDVLIAAAGLLRTRTVAPFRLAIVGPPPRRIAWLTGKCAAAGIADLVDVVPFVPHRMAMQWIKESDIGVIPHADTEGIRTTVPFKLFDYMSAGAMCVVSDVPPLNRIVRETGAGATFRTGDPEALAATLQRAVEHHAERTEAGRRGREAVEARYNWELQGREYIRFLESVVTGGTRDRLDGDS